MSEFEGYALFLNSSSTLNNRLRLWIVSTGITVLFVLLITRLFWVTLYQGHPGAYTLPPACPVRSDILDRNDTILASSLPTYSVYAHPHHILHKEETVQALCSVLPTLSPKTLRSLLSSSKPFIWIIRHISPEEKMKIHALGIEGIGLLKEQKRLYPHDHLFSHVLGLTNVDQEGIAGIEKALNERLKVRQRPIHLSVDTRLQHIIHANLSQAISKFQATGGSALLVDMTTGEILSMVSLPDFSPTHLATADPRSLFNRNVSGVYEFGSILKIMTTAMVLESKTATLHSVYDASYPLRLGRFTITDFRGKNRPLTVKEAFIYSSNIATAKMALDAGAKCQVTFFQKLGLLSPVRVELPEGAQPLIPPHWTKFQVVTASYGYGFSVTPLHIVQSIQTLVTGCYRPLTLLRQDRPIKGRHLISEKTCQTLIHLLGLAVIEGQAKKAAATNCVVGAKTGTANLNTRGRYCQKENFTSCIGIFPLPQPRYALLVCIERPKPNAETHYYATAGWIAAPVISAIVDQVASVLGLMKADNLPVP